MPRLTGKHAPKVGLHGRRTLPGSNTASATASSATARPSPSPAARWRTSPACRRHYPSFFYYHYVDRTLSLHRGEESPVLGPHLRQPRADPPPRRKVSLSRVQDQPNPRGSYKESLPPYKQLLAEVAEPEPLETQVWPAILSGRDLLAVGASAYVCCRDCPPLLRLPFRLLRGSGLNGGAPRPTRLPRPESQLRSLGKALDAGAKPCSCVSRNRAPEGAMLPTCPMPVAGGCPPPSNTNPLVSSQTTRPTECMNAETFVSGTYFISFEIVGNLNALKPTAQRKLHFFWISAGAESDSTACLFWFENSEDSTEKWHSMLWKHFFYRMAMFACCETLVSPLPTKNQPGRKHICSVLLVCHMSHLLKSFLWCESLQNGTGFNCSYYQRISCLNSRPFAA